MTNSQNDLYEEEFGLGEEFNPYEEEEKLCEDGEEVRIRLWNTYSKLGKTLAIAGIYPGLDLAIKFCTGNHIHELLGINTQNINQVIEQIELGVAALPCIYGSFKCLELKLFPDESYEKYKHLAEPIKKETKIK